MIKRFVFLLFCVFFALNAHADTETINWYVDRQTYATTTCESGDDILLPTTPTKRGYVFQGWRTHTPIEYLESACGQYIDTGYKPNLYTRVEASLITPLNPSQNYGLVFGEVEAGKRFFFFVYPGYAEKSFRLDLGNSHDNKCSHTSSVVNRKIFVDMNNAGKTSVYNESDNTKLCEFNVSPIYFSSTQNMVIFNPECTIKDGLIIYYVKIWDNDVLVRDFIPVLDPNNVPCMYDKVTEQFFYNQGTGDFIAGPVVVE